MYKKMILILVVGAFLLNTCAFGDEVSSTIENALKSYNSGKFVEAANALEQASQRIRQKRAGTLEALLPAPLRGWDATLASSQTVSTAFLGGGVFAERTYRRGHDATVHIKIVTDSPMVQSIMMMLTNPMVITASGGRLTNIKGNQAIIKYDPQTGRGDINIVIGNRFLITVNGNMVDESDMVAYAENIDYDGLNKMP